MSRRESRKRTNIPEVYRRAFARTLRKHLERVSRERVEQAKGRGEERSPDIAVTLSELASERGITVRTANAYLRSERFPGAYDMRELALFCGVTSEELMTDIPNLHTPQKDK